MEQFLETGQIVNTHGIRGEVRIQPWSDSPEFLLDFSRLFIDGTAYEVESARVQKSCVLMKFKGVDDVDAANRLRGKNIRFDRSDVTLPEGAVFFCDLVGLSAIGEDGASLGKITEVIPMPKQDVYVIRGAREYLVPAVPEFILETNVADGFVRVRIIEGMASDEN